VSNMRTAALALATEGFRIFPLPLGQKRANLQQWQKKATTDSAQIEEWFPPGDLAPNIGLAAGGGLLVLDEDPRHGSDASIADLQIQHGILPPTRTVRTPSGGLHRYYRVPAARHIPNSTSKLGKGLDIRGDGGYVVAAPSKLVASPKQAAGAYVWENPDAPIADAPAWLIERATEMRAPMKVEETSTAPQQIESHSVTPADARDMLKHLDTHRDDYEPWAEVLWTLRRMSLGAQDGSTALDWLACADEWSRDSHKYNGIEDVRAKMPEADKRPGYGWRHFLHIAKAAGFTPTDEQLVRWGLVSGLDDFTVPQPDESHPARFKLIPIGEFVSGLPPKWIIKGVIPHG
jgi:hypothetical protein